MDVLARVDRLRSELSARFEVDVPGLLAGVRARLESRLTLTPLAIDSDLAEHRGRFGLGRVRSWAFESAALRKVVLTHVHLRPIVEGLALVLAPRREIGAPVFAADLMVLPMRIAVNADVYGAAERTRGVLAPLGPSFARLQSEAGPAWSSRLASGEGLHARASARLVDELFAALTGALGRYIELLAAAPAGDPEATQRDQEAFFSAFHAHGPRAGALGRLFGGAWAERYSRLAFE